MAALPRGTGPKSGRSGSRRVLRPVSPPRLAGPPHLARPGVGAVRPAVAVRDPEGRHRGPRHPRRRGAEARRRVHPRRLGLRPGPTPPEWRAGADQCGARRGSPARKVPRCHPDRGQLPYTARLSSPPHSCHSGRPPPLPLCPPRCRRHWREGAGGSW